MPIPPLLDELLRAPGPPGAEDAAMAVWRREAGRHGELETDTFGNTTVRLPGADARPLVAVMAHVDEIGVVVTHVTDDGLLSVGKLGGVRPAGLHGQRVELLGPGGPVPGVVSRSGDEDKVDWDELFVDIGASSREQALELVRLGDPGVVVGPPLELAGGRFASKALDNRLCAYVALEALRELAEEPPAVSVAFVGSVQEETSAHAAVAAAHALAPDAAVVLDITFATDTPGKRPGALGHITLGGGPSIFRGPSVHPALVEGLILAAAAEGIAHSVESAMSNDTDAERIALVGSGIPCAVLSVPIRYIHTPYETAQLSDVEDCVRLLVAFLRRLEPGTTFLR